MSRPLGTTFACALMLLATGCMSTYRLPPGAQSASIRVAPGIRPWICADTEPQNLSVGKDGRANIPVGKPISIGANYYYNNGIATMTCTASIGLVPEVGARYYQDYEAEGNYCTALVYRETDENRVGLTFEPTVRRGGVSCRKR